MFRDLLIANANKKNDDESLPNGYIPIEYIRTIGNAWLDTGLLPSQDMEVTCKFSTNQPGKFLFGSRDNTISNGLTFYPYKPFCYVAFGSSTLPFAITVEIFDLSPHIIVLSQDTYNIDGIEQSRNNVGKFNNPSISITVGVLKTANNTIDNRKFVGNIYSFTIKGSSGDIINLIPCINPNNEVGMWDSVSKKFFGSVGGESFISGPEILGNLNI